MANYNFVIDSSFKPYTLQDMLVPLSIYKDAYEKTEEAYRDLADKASFEYLNENLPDDSKSRAIYNKYSKDLNDMADDLSRNGLTMKNRSALTSLKKRYSNEVGRVIKAQESLDKYKEVQRNLSIQDPTRLYATNNYDIDDFLDGKTPNLYSISGTDLYNQGAVVGKNLSAKQFNIGETKNTLGGYYIDFIQKQGYSPQDVYTFGKEILEDFSKQVSTLPELQQAAYSIMKRTGAYDNLTGEELNKAVTQVVSGIVENAVYQEVHNPQRNLGVLTATENEEIRQNNKQMNLNAITHGLRPATPQEIANGRPSWVPDENGILNTKVNKENSNGNSDTNKVTQLGTPINISWTKDEDPIENEDSPYETSQYDEEEYKGKIVNYEDLPSSIKDVADKYIGDGTTDLYDFYYQPYEYGLLSSTHANLQIIPRKVETFNNTPILNNFGL